MDKTDCSNHGNGLLLLTTYKNISKILLSRLTPYTEEIIGLISGDFDGTFPLLIIHTAFVKHLKKWENKEAVRQQFRYFKKHYDSHRRGGKERL